MSSQKAKVVIYTKDRCYYCINAKNLLDAESISFSEIKLEHNPEAIDKIREDSGWRTFPIIMINNKLIGGYTDLKKIKNDGTLKKLVKSN